MTNDFPSMVVDKDKILNKGFPMSVTKLEGTIATVEYFEGKELIHKVIEVDINRLKLIE